MATIRDYMDDMRNQGKTPHFTNMPGKATPDSFSYDEGGFTAETERQLQKPGTGFDYTPDYMKEQPAYQPSMVQSKEKVPAKPPDSALQPEGQRDYSDRDKYRAFVVKQMKFDPHTLNPNEEVEKAQASLPELFQQAFGGKILYRDIDKLTKEQKKHWDDVQKEGNAHIHKAVAEKAKIGKEEFKMRMKVFDDKQAEKKAIPGAIDKSLKNMFTSLDGSGKSVVEVPPTVRSQAIMEAVELVNSGKFSGVEAVPFVIQKLAREKAQIADIKDALDSLPEWKAGWFTSDAQDIEKHKQTIADAVEMVGDEKEVKKALKEKGWTDKNIALVMPKKTEAAEVSPEMGSKQKYNTVFDVAEALKRGEISRPEAKRLAMGIKGSKKIATDYMKAK